MNHKDSQSFNTSKSKVGSNLAPAAEQATIYSSMSRVDAKAWKHIRAARAKSAVPRGAHRWSSWMAKLKAHFIIDSNSFSLPEPEAKLIRYSETYLDGVVEFYTTFDEGQRQLILLALATLSLERPGIDSACEATARQIDNLDRSTGRAELYDQFRYLNEDKYRKWRRQS